MRHTAKMHLISCDTKHRTVPCAHICKWRDKTKGHGLLARVPIILNLFLAELKRIDYFLEKVLFADGKSLKKTEQKGKYNSKYL